MTIPSPASSASAFASWTTELSGRGLTTLPSSHPVPVELWVRAVDGTVLHFRARGTTLLLRRYDAASLTGLILRSECDCESHRTAGAGRRTVLAPGARPQQEVRLEGAAEFGWTTVEAGLLDVPAAAGLFDRLLDELTAVAPTRKAVAVA